MMTMMMIPNPSFSFWASIKKCTLASSNLSRVITHDAAAAAADDDDDDVS